MGQRINFLLPKPLGKRFLSIPWGQRSTLLRKMVEITCFLWETRGHAGLAIILDHAINQETVQLLNIIEETQKSGTIGGSTN